MAPKLEQVGIAGLGLLLRMATGGVGITTIVVIYCRAFIRRKPSVL